MPKPIDTATTAKALAAKAAAARAEVERRAHADRESIFTAQAAAGRARRLQKAARKDPAVAALLAENEKLRAELAALKASAAQAETPPAPPAVTATPASETPSAEAAPAT